MATKERLKTKGVSIAMEYPTPRDVDLPWRCAGHNDPELFHPTDEATLAEAKAFCSGCGVRALCRALGQTRDEWGVWGGVLLENGEPIAEPRKPGRPRKVPAA